jgi:uncharacterized phage protein (TIGR01671 family)
MREIKFRQFCNIENHHEYGMNYFDLYHGSVVAEFGNVMQFTGLLDKNGKEIFEGDIILLGVTTGVVEFGEQDIGHDWQSVGFFTREKDGSQFNLFGGDNVEIIGNVYQNPELI